MKKKSILSFFIYLLLLVFICSYFIEFSGYYEYNLANKKNLTEHQIKQFESDVKEGKKIDINSYFTDSAVDYSNKLTKTTSEINLKLNEYLKKIIINTFKFFEKFIY